LEFSIRGRHMDVPDRLRAAVEEKVTRLVRHLDGYDEAEVQFFEERNPRISEKEVCEVTLRGHGRVLRAKAASADPFTAVDRVVDKLSHQAEKVKTRQSRKGHHRRGPVEAGPNGSDQVVLDDDEDEEEERPGTGRIVKVKRFDLKPMTAEEASMQMELLGHTFYFFTNAETGVPAVVYRRDDGDVGLIDAG
jgi:putative sigma-54 modulation protein